MRAVKYFYCGEADDVLDHLDVPDPEPGPADVLVRIGASGVNPHDTKKRSGWLSAAIADEGIIPHSDGAGEIAAVGSLVNPDRVGQRVFFGGARPGYGTAADYCVIGAHRAFPLPDSLSFEQGASLGVPAFTAWLCILGHQRSLAGKTVLIHGGSGCVGRVAVELAAWSLANVIATAGSDERCTLARAKGAHHVLNYRTDDIAGTVLDLTDGFGVDLIVDVDFAANIGTNIDIIRDHGLICSYSSTSNRNPVLSYYGLALKGASVDFVQGAMLDGTRLFDAGTVLCALLERGKIIPDVSDVFPFTECAQAHKLVESGKADGNVVIVP